MIEEHGFEAAAAYAVDRIEAPQLNRHAVRCFLKQCVRLTS